MVRADSREVNEKMRIAKMKDMPRSPNGLSRHVFLHCQAFFFSFQEAFLNSSERRNRMRKVRLPRIRRVAVK